MPKLKLPLRDSQDESPASLCEECFGEVWSGETLFRWNGKRICEDCFKHKVRSWLELSPRQIANALDFPYESVP